MRKLKVLLLFDSPYFKPRGYDFKEEFKDVDWDAERYTYKTLSDAGHQVRMLGLYNDISILFEEIKEVRPDVIFNLVEVFRQKSHLDKNVAGVLEMLGIPYTGATPATLFVCNNKALTKQILTFHRIKIPHFYTFYRGKRIWLPKRLRLPLVVKPMSEEASRGISQASIVDDEKSLVERVSFIHESFKNDAIVEEYIDGREFYVSVIGAKHLTVLPFREMKFGEFADDEPRIATYKAKWDHDYRKRHSIKDVFAGRLPNGIDKKIEDICKRAYRALNMDCYTRFDIRLAPDGRIYILEVNANPSLDRNDELVQSAEKAGITYTQLVQKIISMALNRGVE
jgi:D-alanine-D-alanine ligase